MKFWTTDFKEPVGIAFKTFALSCLVAFLLYTFFVVSVDTFLNSDYLSFLTGAKMIATGDGSSLYDFSTQLSFQKDIKISYVDKVNLYPREKFNQALPFRNLPFVALFFVPLVLLPPFVSFKIFALFNLCLLIFILWNISKDFLKKISLAMAVLASFAFLPVLTSLVRGQITLVALFVFYMVYKNLQKKRNYWAGFLSGFLLMKVQYLFAVPFIVMRASDLREFFKGFLLVFSVLIVLSFLVTGINVFSYPGFLLLTEQAKYGSVPSEILTLFSVFGGILSSKFLALILNIIFYFSTLYLFWRSRKSFSLGATFGVLVLATLVFGVHMTDNEVVLMLFPLFLLLEEFYKTAWARIFFVVGLLAPFLRLTPFAFWEIAVLGLLLVVLFLRGRFGAISS